MLGELLKSYTHSFANPLLPGFGENTRDTSSSVCKGSQVGVPVARGVIIKFNPQWCLWAQRQAEGSILLLRYTNFVSQFLIC